MNVRQRNGKLQNQPEQMPWYQRARNWSWNSWLRSTRHGNVGLCPEKGILLLVLPHICDSLAIKYALLIFASLC